MIKGKELTAQNVLSFELDLYCILICICLMITSHHHRQVYLPGSLMPEQPQVHSEAGLQLHFEQQQRADERFCQVLEVEGASTWEVPL